MTSTPETNSRPLRLPLLLLLLLAVSSLILAACAAPGTVEAPRPTVPPELKEQVDPDHEPGPLVQVEELIIAMLLISALVSLLTQRVRIPYTTGLVLVGFALTFLGSIPALNVTPELIMALLVPPLVYEAAFQLNSSDLRQELRLVLRLAIPGVIITTALVGGLVSLTSGISLPYALVFGALIAATDPVAVVAMFRSLRVPRRLQVLVEGESLFNDGTAIVLYNMMLAVAITGELDLGRSVVEFFIVAGGGIAIGMACGILISQLIGKIDNYLVETSLTSVLAYGSYLLAEYFLGFSGVLAVVGAGLMSGAVGPRGMSPTTRIVVSNFWEFAAFLANSFVFLIIGLEMDLLILVEDLYVIGVAILAVLAARALVVYGLSVINRDIPVRWKHILYWGGMQGAISLALALSLPEGMPFRREMQSMAFGVVFFMLVVKGLSLQPVIRRLKIIGRRAAELDFERKQARATAVRASLARIRDLNRDGVISDYTVDILLPLLERQIDELTTEIQTALQAEPGLHREELVDAWREGLRAQRSALTALYHDNILSEETYSDLVADVDFLLANPEDSWAELESRLEPFGKRPEEA